MRIVFLARLFLPHIGGVEKHVYEIAKILKNRHQIKIITERHDPNLKELEVIDEIEVYRIKAGNKGDTWREISRLKHILDWADVIHAHDVYFWIAPYKLLHPLKRTYITFHGWEEHYPIPLKNILVRKLSEWMASGTICVGSFISKWYRAKPDYITYGAA